MTSRPRRSHSCDGRDEGRDGSTANEFAKRTHSSLSMALFGKTLFSVTVGLEPEVAVGGSRVGGGGGAAEAGLDAVASGILGEIKSGIGCG